MTALPPHAHKLHVERLSLVDRVALRGAAVFGSVPMFVACCAWLALAFIVPATRSTVFFVSSGVIQLVALPLLGIASNLLSKQSEARADADFQVNQKSYTDIEDVLARLERIEQAVLGVTTDIRKVHRGRKS